ncbi:protocadherin Fat 4-like [Haliotis cracherodii]|uniref:protocadherin Fat 4-like n=1 Tax=Haliotis cracherodii TaxID=6455 RepID=UPI0039E8C515
MQYYSHEAYPFISTPDIVVNYLHLATTTPTPSTCGPMTDASLDEDCSNARCVAVNSSCVTTSAGSRRCACVNKNVQISATECSLGPSVLSSTTHYVFSTDLSRTSVTVGSIIFDGLNTFPPNSFSIEGEVYPDEGILDLKRNSTHIDVALVKEISNAKTFVVVLRATSGEFTVQQVVTVRITSSSFTPEDVTVMLVEGTRKDTLIADVRTTGSLGGYSNFEMETTDDTARALFNVTTSGQVLCGQDMILSDFTNNDTVAKEYIFSVKTRGQSATIATFYILLFKGKFTTRLNENWVGDILTYSITSSKFQVVINDTLPDGLKITKDLTSVRLVNAIDFDAGIKSIDFKLDLVTTDRARSTSANVHINIEDLNDEPPELNENVYEFTVLAGSKRDSVVGVVDVTDGDTVGWITFHLEGENKDDFSINDDGILTSKVDLTRGRFPSAIPLRVKAYDGVSYSDEAIITVYLISHTINAVNLNKTFLGRVSENSAGAFVANVAVSNYTSYKFRNSRAHRFFSLNPTSGIATTAIGLDRENDDQAYTEFTIQAYMGSDDQCSPLTIGQLITNIMDLNDNAPEFSRRSYTGRVKENSIPGTLVDDLVDIAVADEDVGVNGSVNFALTGPGKTNFAVEKLNHNKFTIKTSGTPIDREVTPYVVLTLTGTDNPSNPNTGTTTLNITIMDVNDNAPKFIGSSNVFWVDENVGPKTITTLTATDKDEGLNAKVSYSLKDGGFGLFQVDASTGEVSTIKAIDRENRKVFNLIIEARDQGSPSQESVLTITVNIRDVNDEKPTFMENSYKSNYKENSPCDRNILTVTATDKDEGSYANIRFSTSSSNFTVDTISGAIRCVIPLDYEEMQQHLIEIKAENPGIPTMSDTVIVEINVEDENDNSPRFDKPNYQSEITTFEWVTNNPVDVFEVTDYDSGTNGQFRFSMGGETDKFYIDGDNVGVLRIKEGASQPVASTTYNFDVTATDKGSPSQSVPVPVSVDVKKLQGNSTVRFSSKDYRFSIVENRLYTTSFGRANAAHDASVSVRYTLFRGDDFRIDPSSGALTCSKPQDREAAQNHTMVVRVRDLATNASELAVITITVEDENDNGPTFLTIPEQHVFSVKENSVDTFIARIVAQDKDAGDNGTITYSIELQTPRIHFSIHPGTGRITVSGDLDREAFDEYNLTIKAADNADVPKSAITQARILILDINDNPPTFQTPNAVTVKEDRSLLTSVATVSATDRDLSQYGKVTYFPDTVMVNGTVCPFKVSVETGVVKVSGDLDYETTSTYECIVTAVDMKGCSSCTGRLTGSTTMSVTILDFNDNPPVFQGAPYRANISRDANINTLVTDVITATDRDGTRDGNGVVKYHILSNIDYFKIDRDSGNIFVATTLDSVDEDEVTLRIKATDLPQADPAMEAITNVTISIMTDKPRPFFKKEYTFKLTENEKPDEDKRVPIRAYVRKESDEFACNCTYEILGIVTDYSESFYVDGMTGDLRQKDPIDREETGSHFYVTVKATDGGSGLYRTKQVAIIVADVNDNFPYFSKTQQNFAVRQSAPAGYVIGRVMSVDADELSRPIYTAFTDVGGIELLRDGTLVVRASLLNYTYVRMVVNVKEDHFKGTFNVLASTNANVYINVRPDDNDHAPTFGKDTYEASLMFLSRKGTEVKINNFRATDADGHSVTYAIHRGNHRDTFKIDSQTGKISVQYTLDDTVPRVLELVVIATDSSRNRRTGSCTVIISLRDFTATECIAENAYSELQQSAQQRVLFLGLFIAMAALLAVISLIAVLAVYKWRTSAQAKQKSDDLKTAQEMQTVPTEYDLLAANRTEEERSYYRLRDRDTPPGVPNEAYVSANSRPTSYIHPVEGSPYYDDADAYAIELQKQIGVLYRYLSSTYMQYKSHKAYPFIPTPDIVVNYLHLATTTPTPPTCGPMTDASLDEDCSNARCVAVNSSCVTTSAGSRRCACVNKNVQISATECSLGPSVLSNTTNYVFSTDLSRTSVTVTVGSIIFEGLSKFPTNTFSIEGEVYPDEGILNLKRNSTHIDVALVKEISNAKTFVVVLRATSGEFTVQQVVTVRITSSSFTPEDVTVMLVEGTRKGTLIADVMNIGSLGGYSNFEMETTDQTARALFNVTTSGQVLCGQDMFLSDFTNNDKVAKEYYFTVKATKGGQRETIAPFYILLFKSTFTTTLRENWKGNILSYTITSSKFQVAINDTLPDRLKLSKDLMTISLVKEIDYDAGITSIHFKIDLVTTNSTKSTTVDVHINIEDQNDERPKFKKAVYEFSLLAGSKGNSVVGVVDVTDGDTVGQTSFSLEGNNKDDFSINDDGVLTSKVDLTKDRFPSAIPLRVKAYDGVSYSEEANITVYLISNTINAVNLNKTFLGRVSENSPGAFVANVAVSNYTSYKFANPQADRFFNLNSTSGLVTTAIGLDRENDDQAYTAFTIQAYMDSGDQCSPVTIGQLITNITDLNDNAPEFSRRSYTGRVKENSIPGTLVVGLVDIAVTDEDTGVNGFVNFALTGTGKTYFAVEKLNHNQFTIKTSGTQIDREVTSYVVLTLTGTDNPSNPNTGTTALNITIMDVNDNAPLFNGGSKVFWVEENVGPKTITTLTATDKDVGLNAKVSYSLKDGGFGLFQVDKSTGEVSTIKAIDRENRKVFNLIIEAKDQGSPSLESEWNITVNIRDVNDEKPTFTEKYYKGSYMENSPCDRSILTVSATDHDEGSNANIRFSTTSSNFTVNNTTGAIGCVIPLDYEEMQQHLIEIKAENPGFPTMSNTVKVEINVEDENDNSPRFDKPNYQSEITTWEWVTNNPVDVFEVTDDDSGTNGLIILSMSGETDKFYIDGDTVGVLRIKEGASPPVASTTYNFDVTATDKGSQSLSVTVPVSVDVKKIQGNSTVRFSSKDYRFSIVENRLYTTSFGRANAAHDANVSVRYTLIHGGDFRIDPSSGALTCSKAQDRETAANHTMVVRARDIATNASDVAVVTVQILDVNDNGPIFLASSGQLVFQVAENSTGNVIGRIIAKDGDADENGTITYSIALQTPRAHFSINPGTGIVTVSGDLDREDYDTYNLTIKATDNADAPRTATTSATILVLDINDNPPIFQTTYAVTVKEDSAISASVETVSATDRDLAQHGAIVYTSNTVMVNGTFCPFNVSVETGVVKVSGDLDYETTSTYECIVTAVDMKGCSSCTGRLTGSTTMSVTILDFNDNPPVFQGAPYRANISRDANINTLVTDVITATDRDGTMDGNAVVKYHMFSNISYFRIDRDSGRIFVASTLDKVNDDEVTLRIKATDIPQKDPAMEAITNITISILTDQPRPFFNKTYTFLLTENEKPDEDKPVSIRAYVRRSSEEACNCTYDLIDNSSFYIDSMTGDLRQKDPIDREKTGSRFYLRVKATDRRSLLYRTTDVEVNVKDVNDNLPYFNNTQQNFIVNQSARAGHVIGRVMSVDADELSHPKYTNLTHVEGIELLDDGTLEVRASLSNYTEVDMLVSVTEGNFNGPINISAVTTTKASIEVRPDDYNEHPPVFGKDAYEASLEFSSETGTEVKITNFRATDADGHNVTYAIQTRNDRENLKIDGQTGKISVHIKFDDTVPEVIKLVIIATDESPYPKTGSCTVTITLQGYTQTKCVAENAYSQLQQQRELFLGLFIAMAALLAVISIAAVFAIYKWRTVRRRTQYQENINPDHGKTGKASEQAGYDSLAAGSKDEERAYNKLKDRDFSSGVPNPAYVSTGPRPTCTPPTDPLPDYDDEDDNRM